MFLSNLIDEVIPQIQDTETEKYEAFWKVNYYFPGSYDARIDFEKLNQQLYNHEKNSTANRIFYLALPPSVFESCTIHIRNACMALK